MSRFKWGASGKRESVINYLMFDINLRLIVVCIFSFARKSGTPPRWIIQTPSPLGYKQIKSQLACIVTKALSVLKAHSAFLYFFMNFSL